VLFDAGFPQPRPERLVAAVRRRGVPMTTLADLPDGVAERLGVSPVLVRPDQHIA
jgi:hypothetical protein